VIDGEGRSLRAPDFLQPASLLGWLQGVPAWIVHRRFQLEQP
jgi:hypothetical protein